MPAFQGVFDSLDECQFHLCALIAEEATKCVNVA